MKITDPTSTLMDLDKNGKLTVKGEVWAQGSKLTSDITQKKNIEPLQSALEKVMQLRGVSFDFIESYDAERIEWLESPERQELVQQGLLPEIAPEVIRQMKEELQLKQIGVIAQEVAKVVPEVVRTKEDGIKGVAYANLVGLLIEAVKELQKEVESLKSGNPAKEIDLKAFGEEETLTGTNEIMAQCKLYQNTPNPFTERTEIRYSLAAGIKQAYICIFDMQGKMLKKLDAMQQESITIQGSELKAGMYLYSLIVDGKEVDTKRMILTK